MGRLWAPKRVHIPGDVACCVPCPGARTALRASGAEHAASSARVQRPPSPATLLNAVPPLKTTSAGSSIAGDCGASSISVALLGPPWPGCWGGCAALPLLVLVLGTQMLARLPAKEVVSADEIALHAVLQLRGAEVGPCAGTHRTGGAGVGGLTPCNVAAPSIQWDPEGRTTFIPLCPDADAVAEVSKRTAGCREGLRVYKIGVRSDIKSHWPAFHLFTLLPATLLLKRRRRRRTPAIELRHHSVLLISVVLVSISGIVQVLCFSQKLSINRLDRRAQASA
jgi:hypothetical protein